MAIIVLEVRVFEKIESAIPTKVECLVAVVAYIVCSGILTEQQATPSSTELARHGIRTNNKALLVNYWLNTNGPASTI